MIRYMLRHRFKGEFYFKPSPREGAVMKAGVGTLFKTKWTAQIALDRTKLQNLQIVEVSMEIKAIKC
jgi:hypothetical protein